MRRNLYLREKEVKLFEIQVVKLEETLFYFNLKMIIDDIHKHNIIFMNEKKPLFTRKGSKII